MLTLALPLSGYVITVYVIQPWIEVTTPLGFLNCLLFNSLCCMAGWAHFKTMTTDPGAIPRTAVPLNFHRKRNVEITVKAGARSGDVVGGISDISPSTTGSTTLNTNASSADIELGIAATAITNNLNDNCTKTMDSVSMTPQALTAKSKQAEQSEQKEYVRCKKCKYFKPPRSHHCSQCRRCITKMDHHCPWVNNCVGIGNQKLFILFLFYIALSSAYALCLIITRYFSCDRYECNVSGGIWTLFLTVESLLFGFFTCCMLVEQLDSIESEETTVERIIRQKNGNGKASGNTASNKSKVEKAKEEASGGGSPISYDIDEFVEIFGHSIYNNGPENTYFQHFRNYIQLLTPTPAQYYSIDMKDKVYCFTNRASSDIENGLENDAELGNDDTSALLKPKHF